MRRTEATAWVVSVCALSLRLSQAKTLAALVAAAMRVQRVSLANIGRMMSGVASTRLNAAGGFAPTTASSRPTPCGASSPGC